MSKHKNEQNASDGSNLHQTHIPYWKRAHTDWRFWLGVMLMFVAMIVYVLSMDLAWRPGSQRQPAMAEPIGQ